MTNPLPIKLPPGFEWIEKPSDQSGARSMSLKLSDQSVLRVVPKRAGWLVVIDLNDPQLPQADVAVHSISAGMRWAARWVQGRAKRLHAMAGSTTPSSAMRPPNATWTALSADDGVLGPLRPKASEPELLRQRTR